MLSLLDRDTSIAPLLDRKIRVQSLWWTESNTVLFILFYFILNFTHRLIQSLAKHRDSIEYNLLAWQRDCRQRLHGRWLLHSVHSSYTRKILCIVFTRSPLACTHRQVHSRVTSDSDLRWSWPGYANFWPEYAHELCKRCAFRMLL